VLFPIRDPKLRARVRDSILNVSLRDTEKCWELLPDGSYRRRSPEAGQVPFNSQEYFMTVGGSWRED
jgi:polyphosphate kinase